MYQLYIGINILLDLNDTLKYNHTKVYNEQGCSQQGVSKVAPTTDFPESLTIEVRGSESLASPGCHTLFPLMLCQSAELHKLKTMQTKNLSEAS